MDFTLSEEHQAFADSVARFAQDKLAAGALERAHSPHYPWETASLLAEQGLLGIAFPEADGGQGGSLMHAVLAIEQVALVCPKSADIVQAGNFGPIRTFVEYADAAQKARFLPDLLAGKKLDRKSTRLNSSHSQISYAVFCLKKKKTTDFFRLSDYCPSVCESLT